MTKIKPTIKLITVFGLTLLLAGCSSLPSSGSNEDVIDHLNVYIQFNNNTYSGDGINPGLVTYESYIYGYEEKLDGYDFSKTIPAPENALRQTGEIFYELCPRINTKELLDVQTFGPAVTMDEIVTNPTKDIPKESREVLINNSTEIISLVDEIEKDCQDFENYRLAEDYKDDNFEEGYKFFDKAKSDLDHYFELKNIVSEEVDSLFDQFYVFDENNPYDVALSDLQSAEKIYLELRDAHSKEGFDIDSVSTEFDELQVKIDLRKENVPSNLDLGDELPYENFYKNFDNGIMVELKKFIRDFEEFETEEEYRKELQTVGDAYQRAVDGYNNFIE